MADTKKRLMNDLRVIDLRSELEKRNLDKSGVRAVLLKRLTKHLKDEGLDPDSYLFDPLMAETKTPVKKSSRSESTAEAEGAPLDVSVEDMIVQDDVCDDEDNAEDDQTATNDPTPAENISASHTESKDLEKMDVSQDHSKSNSRKRELKVESPATEAKKVCLNKVSKIEDEQSKAELNNTDAEDSINLDIGDDELLNDETDNSAKARKDESGAREHGEAAPGSGAADTAQATGGEPDAPADKEAQQEVNCDADTTSGNPDDKKDKEQKDDKDASESGDKKDRKDEGKEGGSGGSSGQARNLWVSGLSGDTRAKDLKQLCSKHGKVIGAKVVTNARTPGSRCYGYVTMASAQDAESCIKNLHRTELHGRMISVEKAKSESGSAPALRRTSAAPRRTDRPDKDDAPKEDNGETKESADKDGESKPKKEDGESGEESARSTSRTRERSHRSDKDKPRRTRSRERRRSPREILTFSKIWKERDVARARERSRAAREEERRRRAAEEALRERERRQRQEKHRLALEREKLRAERERIEREKNELLRLERERHKLEREKLELERLELKRAQLRLEEERRKRGYEVGAAYRKPAPSPPPPPAYERDPRDVRHKRPPPPSMASSRGTFEAPPPPRFELAAPAYERAPDKRDRDRERDYKRDYPRHISSNLKYASNGNANDDSRQPLPPGTRPKEPSVRSAGGRGGAAYEPREARAYRSPPPAKPEPRAWSASSRYPDASASTKEYGGSGSGDYGKARAAPPAPSARTNPTWSKPGGGGGDGGAWGAAGGGGGGAGAGEARYYEARAAYPPAYQPPPPGAAPYPDRYPAPSRDYRQKY